MQARRSCWRRLGNRHARQHPAARPSEHTPSCLSAHWLAQRGTPAFNPAPRCYSVLKSLAGCVRAAASPGTPRQHSPAPAQHNGDEHRNKLAGWLMQHALTPIAECSQFTGGNRMRVAAVITGNARAVPPPGRRRMVQEAGVLVSVLTRPAARSSRTRTAVMRPGGRRCSKITRMMPRFVRWAVSSVPPTARTGWHGWPRFEAWPSFLPSGNCSPELDGWARRACNPARTRCTDMDTGCRFIAIVRRLCPVPVSHRQAASHRALPGRAGRSRDPSTVITRTRCRPMGLGRPESGC